MRRRRRIFKNLLLCLLLALGSVVVLDFPAYTVEAMCREVEREYLLADLEPLYVLRDRKEYSDRSDHFTFVVARSGERYIAFQYEREGLQSWKYYQRYIPKLGQGTLCTARNGTLYVAGPLGETVSAVAEVTVEQSRTVRDPETGVIQPMEKAPEQRTFRFQGELAGEDLVLFRYREGEPHFRPETTPEAERNLEDLAHLWYREYYKGVSGYSVPHVEVPVTVTLYGGQGQTLDTWELSVDTYELRW